MAFQEESDPIRLEMVINEPDSRLFNLMPWNPIKTHEIGGEQE